MFDFLKEYTRRKLLHSKKINEKAKFLNLQDVKQIGFIFKLESLHDVAVLEQIVAYFKKVNLPFSALVVELKNGLLQKDATKQVIAPKNLAYDNLAFVPYSSLTWAGRPRLSVGEDFINKNFDLLISFNDNDNFTLNYITTKINANCIVGMSDNKDIPYTLVIKGSDNSDLSYYQYLKQVFHYLNIIKGSDFGNGQ